MSISDIPLFTTYKDLLEDSINSLSEIHQDILNDTPIDNTDVSSLLESIRSLRPSLDTSESQSQTKAAPPHPHNAIIESVARDLLVTAVATVEISEPAFAYVWILLDIITILSDHEFCDPGLGLWLIEDLLDTQTIDGCRKVFDYLESRRERLTAKHFKTKSLVVLRCCNDLLRRLSRAEDTVFCGRVFIFLFQSFPLGDKSSVNLRGEFHVENVTTFDSSPQKSEDAIKPMDLDPTSTTAQPGSQTPQHIPSGAQTPVSASLSHDAAEVNVKSATATARGTPVPRGIKTDPKQEVLPPPDLDALYPRFWTLQSFFSAPTRLFEPANMSTFKDGIELTLTTFKSISQTSAPTTNPTDIKRGLKRKRTDLDPSNTSSTFNPKYLTNRDLFDLELHDPSFRRHILVQALIMLDFLLSLSSTSKAKSANDKLTNKSVLYGFTLAEEDAKWAVSTRSSIALYLQQSGGSGNEGKFYYRMVDMVLSRDKNWVRWKAESCPTISQEGVSAQEYVQARDHLSSQAEKSKAALTAPPGSADLAFLSKHEPLEALKHPSKRRKLPTLDDYYKGIQTDELDLDFAMDDDEKNEIEERKAGKVWRALRASGRRFVLCEKIQYGTKLDALVKPDVEDEAAAVTEPKNEDVDAQSSAEAEQKQTNGNHDEMETANSITGKAAAADMDVDVKDELETESKDEADALNMSTKDEEGGGEPQQDNVQDNDSKGVTDVDAEMVDVPANLEEDGDGNVRSENTGREGSHESGEAEG
ncbi:hypothetical protein PV10_02426 [Exophiala mesophila]|uniref:Nuclear matrix protein n=1 Tax=Exophiala mesophila TaxID=212818 RepID=A0A0D1ZJ85_EXOME|nr:uncharacterized protein PV10_02426 [Exophiala mesophila]KIV94682.1 hypothetical protein PV10_02426 [Exophiala mesophila]